jgi:hypothetical protein
MAHNIQDVDGKLHCTSCGLRQGFHDGCKFSIEKEKIEVENKKIEVENKKVILGAVLSSLGYLIFFLFVAVVYLGLDGMKMQISRVVDECKKGGAISHLFRRR